MRELDEKQLIQMSCAGNVRAFETLVERHYDLMYRAAFRWSGNPDDAKDITHNAFLKMADKLSTFRFDSRFETWLYRLVINTARDWLRQQRRISGRYSPLPDDLPGQDNAEHDMRAREMMEHIFELPEGERDAVLLVCGEGLSHGEAAAVLKCSEGTISWRVHKARGKLQAMFDKDAGHG